MPDDLEKTFGKTKENGIVYLSESGSHRVNFANIFADLSKLLPTETANSLDAIYKNPQVSSAAKMGVLVDKFPSKRVVLLLDNIEPLINVETFSVSDAELDESLCAFLHGEHSALKIILTTRIAPRGLNLCEPGRQRILDLDDGLEQKYAKKMLQEMDADGKLGLKAAKNELLNLAHKRTLGYPRALEALFAILASDRYTTLEEILATAENYLPDEVVEALVGEAFNRLDVNAQKVMQALAVYNRPVTPAAVDYLLAPHLPAIDSAPILQRLANMHFARKESGRFYLHPVDRDFAYGLIPAAENREQRVENSDSRPQKTALRSLLSGHLSFTQHDLTSRAADYFRQARKPRAEWKKLDDLAAQLAEFDLRCEAGDYDTAASVLSEIDHDYLLLWGYWNQLLNYHLRLNEKLQERNLILTNLLSLGRTYDMIGNLSEASHYYEKGLKISQQQNMRKWEGQFVWGLGQTFQGIGKVRDAINLYEQQLEIARDTGNKESEENAFGNLASAYADLGDDRKAIEFNEQALAIAREIGNHQAEEYPLVNLGSAYADLGDDRKAIAFYEQALVIAREIGDRRGEGVSLGNIAERRIELGEFELAIQAAEQYVKICEEINKPSSYAYGRLAQAYLHKAELIKARKSIDAALKYDEPQNNHNISILLGIVVLRQGEQGDASATRQAFTRAIAQADEILAKTPDYYTALDAKGLAACGLAICDDKKYVADAIETFRAARKIAPHAGVVKSVLRLFDELAKCDTDGILKDVRNAAEGKE